MSSDEFELVAQVLRENPKEKIECTDNGRKISIQVNGRTLSYELTQEFTQTTEIPFDSVYRDAVGIQHNGPIGVLRGIAVNDNATEFYVTGFDNNWTQYTLQYNRTQ